MGMKAGLKCFGEAEVDTILEEYMKLEEKGAFELVMSKNLKWEDKSKALRLLTMVKQKRCGKIKGRTCANGSKKKRYLKHKKLGEPKFDLTKLMEENGFKDSWREVEKMGALGQIGSHITCK